MREGEKQVALKRINNSNKANAEFWKKLYQILNKLKNSIYIFFPTRNLKNEERKL